MAKAVACPNGLICPLGLALRGCCCTSVDAFLCPKKNDPAVDAQEEVRHCQAADDGEVGGAHGFGSLVCWSRHLCVRPTTCVPTDMVMCAGLVDARMAPAVVEALPHARDAVCTAVVIFRWRRMICVWLSVPPRVPAVWVLAFVWSGGSGWTHTMEATRQAAGSCATSDGPAGATARRAWDRLPWCLPACLQASNRSNRGWLDSSFRLWSWMLSVISLVF